MASKAYRSIKTISTTKTRIPKNGSSNNSGYKQCNICHGTGMVRKSSRKT